MTTHEAHLSTHVEALQHVLNPSESVSLVIEDADTAFDGVLIEEGDEVDLKDERDLRGAHAVHDQRTSNHLEVAAL